VYNSDKHGSAVIGAEYKGDHQTRARSLNPLENGPTREQILDALQRILGNSDFIASDRNRRFLQYVVEKALAGHSDRLKGYTIAVEVFGRDATFDGQIDPLVRVEARRLRDSLERYYLTAGKADAVRISIPKGGYVPVFEQVIPAHVPSQPGMAQPASDAIDGKSSPHPANWLVAALLATTIAVTALLVAEYAINHGSPCRPGGLLSSAHLC
jgi:hypothetical protein